MTEQRLPSVLRLKKRAKAMRKASDLSHTQCLAALAQQYGFSSWASLAAASLAQPHRLEGTSVEPRGSMEAVHD